MTIISIIPIKIRNETVDRFCDKAKTVRWSWAGLRELNSLEKIKMKYHLFAQPNVWHSIWRRLVVDNRVSELIVSKMIVFHCHSSAEISNGSFHLDQTVYDRKEQDRWIVYDQAIKWSSPQVNNRRELESTHLRTGWRWQHLFVNESKRVVVNSLEKMLLMR